MNTFKSLPFVCCLWGSAKLIVMTHVQQCENTCSMQHWGCHGRACCDSVSMCVCALYLYLSVSRHLHMWRYVQLAAFELWGPSAVFPNYYVHAHTWLMMAAG